MARFQDIEELTKIMNDVDSMDLELRSLSNVVNSRTIELKSKIKKTISNPQVLELLNRLEIKGIFNRLIMEIFIFLMSTRRTCLGSKLERKRPSSCSQNEIQFKLTAY